MPINYDRVLSNMNRLRPGSGAANEDESVAREECLTPVERDFLRLIANNSTFSITPQRIPLLIDEQPMRPYSPLSIATISTSFLYQPLPPGMPESALPVPNHFKPISRSSDQYRLFTLENHLSVKDMKDFLVKAVLDTGKALRAFENADLKDHSTEGCARLIVINEFGFPFPLEPQERRQLLEELEQEMVQDLDMLPFWETCYLVFGTYHCHNEMKNSAVISLPYVPPVEDPRFDRAIGAKAARAFRKNVIGDLHREGGGRCSFTQDKIVAAEKIGEKLVPRATVDWTYYDTDMGRIGVLICFDALDPRMLLRLALLRLRDTNTAVTEFSAVIVPCFSLNDHVAESCRLLSNIMDTLVVYVNVQYADKGATEFEIPSVAEPRTTSQAFYYRGKLIREELGDPDIITRDSEEAIGHDTAKNLWYARRFCHLGRWSLHERHLAKSPFSSLFLQIFDPQGYKNALAAAAPPPRRRRAAG